jgi:GntR family transcriptional regulator / MocR family aminotransferase
MELHVSLVGRKDLGGEIYRQLRRAILKGQLRPGDPLPPSRELARRLTVSRSTVTGAYDRLAGEGFATARVGAASGRHSYGFPVSPQDGFGDNAGDTLGRAAGC